MHGEGDERRAANLDRAIFGDELLQRFQRRATTDVAQRGAHPQHVLLVLAQLAGLLGACARGWGKTRQQQVR